MSGKLVVKHAFGINPIAKNCLTFTDDHHLAYVCGHQVVVINTETKDQGFIQFSSQNGPSLAITAIASSLSKKIFAVAEKSDPFPVVTIYDSVVLRKKKILNFTDLGSKEIRCMSFSEDGKLLLTQGAGPEWNLVLWNVEKTPKIICTQKISMSDDNPVHQVSFCPWDPTVIVAFGKAIMRLFRIAEGALRQGTLTVRRENANFTSHCWLPDETLIVGTDGGEIFFLESLDFRAVVYPSGGGISGTIGGGGATSGELEDLKPVLSLAPTSRGGFVSGHSHGELRVFERSEDLKEQFVLENCYHIPGGRGNILAVAPGADDNLVLASDTQQLLHFTVSSLQNSKEPSGFDNLFTSFHGPNSRGEAAITGLGVALWKPVVVTCGMDRTLRIWNVVDKRIELMKTFDDEPTALAVHPSGIFLAIGFNDKMRIMSVLLDDLCLCKEVTVRFCTLLKFSHGGHFIAAVNSSYIQVFHTFTGQLVCTLRGHNNKIRNVVWLTCDARLMSIGSEGTIYFWDVYQGTRRSEQYANAMGFISGSGPSDGSKAYAATADRMIKEISFTKTIDPNTGLEINIRDPREVELGYITSAVLMDESRNLLLLGTAEEDMPGSIIAIQAYTQLSSSFDVTTIHSGPITAMCMTFDGMHIVSADMNGCLCISEFEGFHTVSSNGNRSASKTREGMASFEFHDEVVVHKAELESRKALTAELTARVEELNLNNEHQMRLKEMEHNTKIREISQKFAGQLKAESEKYENLLQEKYSLEEQYKNQMLELAEKEAKELNSTDLKYRTKLNAESNRHKLMIAETEESHRRWNEENNALVESHQRYLAELTEDYEDKLHQEQTAQQRLQREREGMQIDFESNRHMTEDDADWEINEEKIKNETKLYEEEKNRMELMAQHALMKKNLAMLTKDVEQQKDEIKRLRDKETRLLDNIRSLEKDIQSHKKEIREREETIADKEKRIFDLKKKNQELEKFRFVLDYKIKELKLQIAPREHEIATMRKQIEEMDLELEQYHKSNQALNLMIAELKLKTDGIRREMALQEHRVDLNTHLIGKYRRDLQELWELKDDPRELKNKVVLLYRVYVQEDMITAAAEGGGAGSGGAQPDGEDPQELYNRDREQMERSLESLRRALKTGSVAHKRDLNKMVRDSILLTKELNTLRKDARQLLLQKKAIDQSSSITQGTSNRAEVNELMALLGIEMKTKPQSPGKSGSRPKSSDAADWLNAEDATAALAPLPPKSSQKKRSAALRHTPSTVAPQDRSGSAGAGGGGNKAAKMASVQDQWEAWKEIEIQDKQMQLLEGRLEALCHSLGLDPMLVLAKVDLNLRSSSA